MKKTLVFPAVYHFEQYSQSWPETKSWHWVLTPDFLEVLNNIRYIHGERRLTAEEVGMTYPHLRPRSLPVMKDGGITNYGTGDTWLQSVISENGYIPVHVARRFLRAVRYPLLNKLYQLFH